MNNEIKIFAIIGFSIVALTAIYALIYIAKYGSSYRIPPPPKSLKPKKKIKCK
jgi:hypothetical protein